MGLHQKLKSQSRGKTVAGIGNRARNANLDETYASCMHALRDRPWDNIRRYGGCSSQIIALANLPVTGIADSIRSVFKQRQRG